MKEMFDIEKLLKNSMNICKNWKYDPESVIGFLERNRDGHVKDAMESDQFLLAEKTSELYGSALAFFKSALSLKKDPMSYIQEKKAAESQEVDVPKLVTLSTIHRAKGLESDVVIFYGNDRCPHPLVVKSGNKDALQQEDNLYYVACTRAKETLILQEIGSKKNKL